MIKKKKEEKEKKKKKPTLPLLCSEKPTALSPAPSKPSSTIEAWSL